MSWMQNVKPPTKIGPLARRQARLSDAKVFVILGAKVLGFEKKDD
jgi:hypothetical protein